MYIGKMEITEYEKIVLEWLYENKPTKFSVNNKEDFSQEFIDSFLWGPIVASPGNIYFVLSGLNTVKHLIGLDNDGYFLNNKGLKIVQDIIENVNEQRIDKLLSRKKLLYETDTAENIFLDYHKVKRERKVLFIIAIIELAAIIIGLNWQLQGKS